MRPDQSRAGTAGTPIVIGRSRNAVRPGSRHRRHVQPVRTTACAARGWPASGRNAGRARRPAVRPELHWRGWISPGANHRPLAGEAQARSRGAAWSWAALNIYRPRSFYPGRRCTGARVRGCGARPGCPQSRARRSSPGLHLPTVRVGPAQAHRAGARPLHGGIDVNMLRLTRTSSSTQPQSLHTHTATEGMHQSLLYRPPGTVLNGRAGFA